MDASHVTDELTLPRPSAGHWTLPAALRARSLAAPLGTAALLAMLVSGTAIAIQAAGGRSLVVPSGHRLPDWLAGAFAGLAPTPGLGRFEALLVAMTLAYAVALACVRALPARRVVFAVVVLHAVFLLAPPLLSTDIFSYADYARLGALHGINPYAHGPGSFRHDEAFVYVGHLWRYTPSVYGPLFTLPTYGLALLGLPATLWSLKLLAAVASLVCVALAGRCAQRLGGSPSVAVALVGLNPLLLIYAVGGGHNDLIMLAAMLGAVALALSQREARAGAAVVAAAAIKVSGLVMLPLMLAARVRRARVAAGALGAAAATIAVGLIAFGGSIFSPFSVLNDIQSGVTAESLPSEVARLVGVNANGANFQLLMHVLLAGALIALVRATWRGMSWITATGWALLALAGTATWLVAWYTLWALPFAAITQDRRLVAATLLVEGLFIFHGLAPLLA
ncbi:MAG TPA: polyprenol phosphomannose-dependent alpha 1,6 mannosyltransferase MptB [Solirubrobacteraceae bacterium]|nr:polyprenol phosphomannose-dependent alpha 1,6 mannosyltransferase MptB [Solirubrobacteraceae bacterium]